MNEKLTLEIAMLYPNARVMAIDDKNNLGKISEMLLLGGMVTIVDEINGKGYPYHISYCKLILRPLSRLTDEEKKEIDMIQRKFSLRALADDNDETYRKHFQRITDKYREWNIDIDGLQERGIAVFE